MSNKILTNQIRSLLQKKVASGGARKPRKQMVDEYEYHQSGMPGYSARDINMIMNAQNPWVAFLRVSKPYGLTRDQLRMDYYQLKQQYPEMNRSIKPMAFQSRSRGGVVVGGTGPSFKSKMAAQHNPWIEFLRQYGNEGYTRDELRNMYHNAMGHQGVSKRQPRGGVVVGGKSSKRVINLPKRH